MNELITLAQAKEQLRILHNFENNKINSFIKAAISSVFNYLDRPINGTDHKPFIVDDITGIPVQPVKLQPDIEAAILMLVDDLYNNRSAKKANGLIENEAMRFLLGPYRKLGV